MGELLEKLETIHGEKQYGYLPETIKKIVDESIDQMKWLPMVVQCYEN